MIENRNAQRNLVRRQETKETTEKIWVLVEGYYQNYFKGAMA
jgi:hypothetical protein